MSRAGRDDRRLHILLAGRRPCVRHLSHRRGRRDGVDEGILAHAVRDIRGGLVACDTNRTLQASASAPMCKLMWIEDTTAARGMPLGPLNTRGRRGQASRQRRTVHRFRGSNLRWRSCREMTGRLEL